MTESIFTEKTTCYHCGDECLSTSYIVENKSFCCLGCKSVYSILSANNLCSYYNFNDHPGLTRARTDKRFDYLDEPSVAKEFVDYTDDNLTIVTLYIPHIHCSSCIWLLEKLNKFNPGILYSRIDFLKKQLNIKYDTKQLSLKQLVELLFDIGYEPLISLQDVIKKQNRVNTQDNLVQRIAVAGFCFGNVMLLSFPEYLGLSAFEQTFKHFFGWLNIMFALPVVFYSGREYFVSAWQNLRNRVLNIDFPLALGIVVLFARTVIEILTQTGAGFADTLCGLVFFLLVGKFVQRKTYHHISFERDYRSFFPVAVQVITNNIERPVPLADLKVGQRIVLRHNEIIPADAILLKGEALIDFSFVTGESIPISKTLGEIIYAGGRQTSEAIELEVVKPVSQSYLTQLWNNEAFTRQQDNRMQTFNERVSKYFTVILLAIAFASLIFWLPTSLNRGLAAFTAVLIVACPCALALSTPFTMSAALSIFDKNFFYLKNTAVVEQMAKIDTVVFDKTGTITTATENGIMLVGALTGRQKQMIYSVCSNSNHPLSRMICRYFGKIKKLPIALYKEMPGKGITAFVDNVEVRAGSGHFMFGQHDAADATKVHFTINGEYLGHFLFKQNYRGGLQQTVDSLSTYQTFLISGDSDHEKRELLPVFKTGDRMGFNQSPQKKLDFIQLLQRLKGKVMMIGDGLNDAGALRQSDLGIAVTDNINNFSPGCDAILDGRSFNKLPAFLKFSKNTVTIIHCSFLISLAYNLIGLSYAVSGNLSPLTAAILMPLSTATIISFTTIATHFAAKRRKLL
ncbi:heavy metal translocating P-type ATPase metal-binding domain-containing protein [Mucilaginibacter sp.]|uniref:heavy metal translocating P-type ATPase n=1 Tax=Mucilaginibacter sp. TaxID=1882438 RepID=UPI0026248133|nr:heavy metal translocating P-type ATPase metal-binding domain-containing protein [Mucilaginibacter sp.]MDB5126165.1 ATPase [Mucilaginibacter sp.]